MYFYRLKSRLSMDTLSAGSSVAEVGMRHHELGPLMRRRLEATIDELAEEFHGVFSRGTVERFVYESSDQLGDRPVIGPNFLPLLVGRFARDRLWALAQAEGRVEKTMPEVLFVCVRNAGRSQMAAALTHRRRKAGLPCAPRARNPANASMRR
jgi:arsenate reductase (thioredoxin)